MRKFYTDGHSRLVKWRPSVSCPLRNCLLLRRSDWCCHCWIQNHGSMLGSSYRLQIPVLQWRITPEMCQKMKMVLPENWYFVDDFPWSSFLKLEMFRFVVFFGVFETFSTIFASRRASSSRHWSYSRCGLQPHCRRCSDLTRRFVCYFFFSFCFQRWFRQFYPCPFHEVCFTNGSNIWKQTGFMYMLSSFADLGAEVHGVSIFGTAGLQLQSIAITSSATATTQITQAGHWRVERVVAASQSQPGRLRKYCECKRPHVFWLDCGMPVLLGKMQRVLVEFRLHWLWLRTRD